jgi:hypothetical protein
MDTILEQIRNALDRRLHYLAVASALTLPDICAALESEDGETKKERYRAWYDLWLGPRYPMITSNDLYRLRSGVVHQGIFGPNGMQYNRIVFMLPGRAKLHCCISSIDNNSEAVLQLDADTFCLDMIGSVRSWLASKSTDASVQKNLPRLLQFRPHGIPPHFVGFPLIG